MVTNRMPPSANDLIGRDANGYVIDALIGEGGMGAVYRGFCPLVGQWGAIKVMLGEYQENAEVVERFKAEARVVAAIDDPNIVPIYTAGWFREDGRMFIVMRYVEGGSLEALCRTVGPLPLDVTAAIGIQVCNGLDAAHALGIVHRDIKTQNILIEPGRHGRKYYVWIVDFGVAKLTASQLQLGFKTRTKAVIGTAGCMAPEQARGDRDVDARADIYSLGMVLYRMLTGRLPYEGDSLYALIEKQIRSAPFPRPRELRPDVPPSVEDLIMACLQVERAKRPRSLSDVAWTLARGVERGEAMMPALGPRFLEGRRTGPEAATLAGDVESILRRWSPADVPGSRRKPIIFAAIGAAAGMIVGGVGVKLATSSGETAAATSPATAHETTQSVAQPSPSSAQSLDAPAAVGVVPTDASIQVATAPAMQSAAPQPPLPQPPPVDAGVTNPAVDAPRPHQTDHAASRPKVTVAKNGTLVVTVKPFAEVFVDGSRVGTTPVHHTLSVGPHKVRLVGPDNKQEELDITISPGKQKIIKREW